MKRGREMLICLVGGLVLSTSAKGATGNPPGTPYNGIVDRNLFALKPPPPPPPKPEPPKPPKPKVTVDGIMSILGRKQVLGKLIVPPNMVTSFMLSEGQREGEVEVLEINEKAASVKFNIRGEEQVITLSTNTTPGAMPPGLPQPGVPPPATVGNPVPPPAPIMPRQIPLPMRPVRKPPEPTAADPPPSEVAGGVAEAPVDSTQVPDPTPDEIVQLIQMRQTVEAHKDEIQRGDYPPLPPTPLDELLPQ